MAMAIMPAFGLLAALAFIRASTSYETDMRQVNHQALAAA